MRAATLRAAAKRVAGGPMARVDHKFSSAAMGGCAARATSSTIVRVSAASLASSSSSSLVARRGLTSTQKVVEATIDTPEPFRVRLPEDDAGNTIRKKIVEWYKKEGEYVASGEALCEVDAGDVVYDFVSPVKGWLVRITAKQGATDLLGNEVIAVLATSQAHVSAVKYQAAKEVAEGRLIEHDPDAKAAAAAASQSERGAAASSPNDAVATWFLSIGGGKELLHEYGEKFRNEGYDSIEAFKTIEDADLVDLGITKRGHQKVIMQAVAALKASSPL